MMIGESHGHNSTVHVPPWPLVDDPTANVYFPFHFPGVSSSDANDYGDGVGGDYYDQYSSLALTTALQRFLPSNDVVGDLDSDSDVSDILMDPLTCDQFRMFDFKVRRCARARSHDWTDCPYAHHGEKARRRDPRRYHYCGTACPDFRKGNCRKGDACEYAHGVFECWLHPTRYRTQPCKDGTNCRRRVCFFAHTPEQLRVLPQSPTASAAADFYDVSPLRHAIEAASCAKTIPFMSSSITISPPMTPPSDSPPMSPITTHSPSRSLGSNSVNEMVASLRNLQLSKMKSVPPASSWVGSPLFGSSPRGPVLRPGSYSLPSTPTRAPTRAGPGYLEFLEEEPEMERVESGRDLRARMFEKLSKEKSLDRVNESSLSGCGGPDVGWVSELLQ